MFPLKANTSIKLLLLSALLVSAYGCGGGGSRSTPIADDPNDPVTQDIPDGFWIQKGFGRALHVAGETVETYGYTRETCLNEESTTQADLAQILEIESVSADEFVATEDAGTLVFSRIDSLPPACSGDGLIEENGPVATLNHFTSNFSDYYPFFELRGITDWQERVANAKARVNDQTTDDELFNELVTLLSGLDDGHVELLFNGEVVFSPASTSGQIGDVLEAGFQDQTEISDFGEYVEAQVQRILEIRDSYFDSGSFAMAGGEHQNAFQWATIGNGFVGYLEVNQMGGITQSQAQSDADVTEEIMDRILTDLADTQALIINVAVNGGGELSVADAIANRFTTESVTVSSYEATSFDDSTEPQRTPLVQRELNPTERVSYRGPIATISGPNTFSAAEHFLLSMRALNHPVCFVGEPSNGILSAILSKPLPTEGVSLGLSNMIVFDHTGQSFEAAGVPVDIEAVTFAVVDSNSERNEAIDAALAALGFDDLANTSVTPPDCNLTNARTRFEMSAP